MPYILAELRHKFEDDIRILAEKIQSGGELNYVITRLAIARARDLGASYENLKSVHGDLVLAAREFARRTIDPYEDKKIADNGDVLDND